MSTMAGKNGSGAGQLALPDSYWVEPGALLAGEYPRNSDDAFSRQKLRGLLLKGVRVFLNLTQPGEFGLKPYSEMLGEEAGWLGITVECRSFPTPDKGVPERGQMIRVLDTIDEVVGTKRCAYVHCYAGVGRTGTVVGCYLIRHGVPAWKAAERIAELRKGTRNAHYVAPESPAQVAMVLGWEPGR